MQGTDVEILNYFAAPSEDDEKFDPDGFNPKVGERMLHFDRFQRQK